MDNESVATNKSHATTCCCSGSNEFGAFNKYKYGANNNKSDGGIVGIIEVCACLLVVYGQQARNPWLFLPYLILGE
uniref:Ovule protein n=1 Tax=Globodera pallida TaxID=36090 RepID=A0A183C5Z5_GLOPA